MSHKSPERRPVKPVSGNFQHPYTFFEKTNQKNHWKGKKPRSAVDCTEHTVRPADKKFSHRKLLSTPIELQRSPKMDLARNKHKLKGPGRKYVSASEKSRLVGERFISESKPNVQKMDSDEEDSDFECYDRSEGKAVLVDIDKELTKEKNPH